MEKEDYNQAFVYENMVRIAYNCERGMKNGADLCFMQNAMTMERGETFAKHLGPFAKQFEKVKTYTRKALNKLSKTKPYSLSSNFFISLENEVKDVNDTSSLIEIVNQAMEKINELKK